MHLLLIEDSADLAANVGEFLGKRGHTVDYAVDGLMGLHLATAHQYDAVILDLNLPRLEGITLCRRLRVDGRNEVPILMLTARDTLDDKLIGFEAGADDYLVKPFSLAELHARLKALARRGTNATGDLLRVADLTFDVPRMIVKRGDRLLDLVGIPLKLLEALMRASPGVLRREVAERALWGDEPPESEASLRGYIHVLRRAIDHDQPQKLVHTIHSVGYRLGTGAGG